MAQPRSERTCLSCGTVFLGSDIAKTCSVRCRKRLQRAKAKLEEEAELAKKSVEELAHKIEVRLEPSFATEGGYVAGSLKPTPRDQAPDDTSSAEAPISSPAHSSYPSADPKTVPLVTTPSAGSSSNSSVTPKKIIPPAASEADSFVSPTNFIEKVQNEGLPPAEETTSSQTTIINHHHYPSAGLPAWVKTAGVMVFVLSVLGVIFFLSNRDQQTPLSQQNQTQALQQLAKSLQNSPIASAQNLGILNFNADTVVNNGKKLTATGQVTLQNQTDSARALTVQNATGQDLLIGDTTNQKVGVGSAPNVADASVLQVAGDVSSTGLRIGGNLVCTANGCTSSTPIPAAVDTSNLAKLNGNQTFTGANSFNSLTVNGNLGVSGAYSSGGSTGVTSSCGSGFALTNPVFAGGLTVGGVCTSISGAATPTLQQSYNASTTPEITVNSTNGALTIQDASTPLGANLFEVQSNGGTTKYFAVTSSGASVTGNVNITGQYQVNGTQIASSNLQDAASLAKLAANQTFSGNNTFSNDITAPGLTTSGLSLNVGNTAAALNLQGNLSSNLSAISGVNTIKVGFSGTPVGSVNYNFDNTAAAGTYTVCTTTGNCAGVGGSVTTSGGTANAIAKFTSSNGIASSNITDNGTTVTVKPTANSISSFQVQNAAGTSNLLIADTTNTRIAIGQATATYPLDVAGDINSTTGIRVGGTLVCTSSGCTATAGSGSYIQNGTATQTANFNVRSAAMTSVGAVVEGASGQTADILDVQSFGGTTKYLAVTTGGIAVAGNVNTTGQYQVGGAQISSANLSNDSNLAKLGGTQTFSGNNTFSGTVLSKNSANSTAAFQVQNAAGNQVLGVDTTNGLVALGVSGGTGVQGQLVFYDTASLWKTTITSSTGHTGNYTLQLPALSAGTYDLCTSSGNCPGVASTLQQAYDASASPATITTSSAAKGIVFKAGTGNDSTNLFQVQNAAGSNFLQIDTINSNITLAGLDSGALGAWSTNSNALPQGLDGHTSVVANGYVYVIGGTNANASGSGVQSTVYYAKLNADGSTGAWSTNTNALPQALFAAASVAANGYVYVLGGSGAINSLSTVYYAKLNADGSTGAWSTNSNSLPQVLFGLTAATANGYVYVMGGQSGSGRQSTVYYAKLNADGSTGVWSTNTNALPVALQFAKAITASGYIYVIGGNSSTTTALSTVYYAKLNADGSTGTWSTNVNSLPAGREAASTVVSNGYVYLIGGGDNSLVQQSTVYYAKLNADGSTGTWSTNSNALPAVRNWHSSVFANGYIYTIGGTNGTADQTTVYYASASRVQIGANLDLVGLQGQTLSSPGDQSLGSTGGSITAGNGLFVGSLQVQGAASFAQGVGINGVLVVNSSASFASSTGLTAAFQVQSTTGSQAVNVSTVTTPNLVSNGDFESTTNGWSGKGSATIARNDTSPSGYSGAGDLKITTTALANDGAYFNYTLAASTQYTLSLYAYSASSISTINIGRQDVSGTDIDCLTAQKITTAWVRYTCTFTTGATITVPTQIYIKQSDATARTFYIDGAQLEQAATASAFQANQANLQVATATNVITLDGSNSGALGPWSTNPNNMPASRQLASSVTANGYVYEIGGYSASGAGPNNTVYYAKLNADGSAGSWATNANALPAARASAASVTANGYVYLLGGDSGAFQSTATSTVYYAKLNADGSTGAWQTNANALPAIREEHGSIIANGYIYVIGGFNNVATQSTVYYAKLNADGSTGAWSTNVSALPVASLGISPVVANGYVYVMGNNSTTVYYAKLNADGSTGAWQTNANPLPAARMYQTSVVSNGYIYVLGGNGTGTGCATASQCYTVYYAKLNADGSAGSWNTNTNSIPTGVKMQSSVVANGYIYSVGGCAANTGVGSCFNNGSTAVYYASASRIQIGANLDLVGLQGGSLSDPGDQSTGSTGGSLTAGNGLFVGSFQVQGNANFAQGLSANGNLTIGGSTLVQSTSTTALNVQSASGSSVFNVDTVNGRVGLSTTTPKALLQFNSTGSLYGLDPSGANATVLGYNVYNNAGSYAAITSANRSGYLRIDNNGIALNYATSAQTADAALTSVVNVLSADTSGNITIGGNAAISGTLTVGGYGAVTGPTSSMQHIESGSAVSGTITAGSFGDVIVNFTRSFASTPSAVASANTGVDGHSVRIGVLSISTTSVTFRIENSNASNSAFTIYWMAIGN